MNESAQNESPDYPDDLIELLGKLGEGTLDEEQRDALIQRLREDPEAVSAYVDHAFLEAMLFRRHRDAGVGVASLCGCSLHEVSGPPVLEHLHEDEGGAGGFIHSPLLMAVSWFLTMLSLCTTVGLGYLLATQRPERVIVRIDEEGREATIAARLTRVAGAKWARRSWSPLGLDYLTAGRRLELAEGLAEVTFNSGARVALEGPAVFTVLGENTAELISGKLSADVPESAKGFVVETPNGPIIDFGTEFGVEIDEASEAAIHVFKGEVEFGLSGADRTIARSVRLMENQAISIDPRTAGVVNFTADPSRFIRKLDGIFQPRVLFLDDFSTDTGANYAGSDSHRQGGGFRIDTDRQVLRIEAGERNTYSVLTKEPVLRVGQSFSATMPDKEPHQAVFLVVSTASAQPTGRGGGSFGLRFRRDERGLLAHPYDSSGPPRWMMNTFTVDPDQSRPVTLSIDRLSPTEFKLYFDFGKGRIPLIPNPIRIPDLRSCERLHVGVEAYGGQRADSFEFDDLRVEPIPVVDSGRIERSVPD